MRGYRIGLLALVGLGLLAWGAPVLGRDTPLSEEEQILQTAGVAIDGPSLVDYLRRRTLTDIDRDRIQTLIVRLGDDSFLLREKASEELILLGSLALPHLKDAAQRSDDLEIVRRAENCLRQIVDANSSVAVPLAAIRLLAVRRPEGAAGVLLDYLATANQPLLNAPIRSTLAAVAIRQGKADPVLVAALTDKSSLKRGAAAEALARSGSAEQVPAVRKLLQDGDATVRLRAAVGLAYAGERDAVPVLIELLPQLPTTEARVAEELLFEIAQDDAPAVVLGADAAQRRQCHDNWRSWWQEHEVKVNLAALRSAPPVRGYTLVALLDLGRVQEVTADGKVLWHLEELQFPLDVQLLAGRRLLLAEHGGNRVTERDRAGQIRWEYAIEGPLVAQRLPNGHTFIAARHKMVELDRADQEVFSYQPANGEHIMRAQKLPNGHYAYVTSAQRFCVLNADGRAVRQQEAQVRTYGGRIDVLPNGHVLVPEMHNNKVAEYDGAGQQVWQVSIDQPVAAIRLPTGNTLVTSLTENRAVEFDRAGKMVWEYRSDTRVTRAFRR
ncbi:MAG: HEAT repeat domain-containing protein [Gemmataceae bacterium]